MTTQPDFDLQAVAAQLQQRIGQLVSQYETDIAIIQDGYNKQIQPLVEKVAQLEKENEELKARVEKAEGSNNDAAKKPKS